MKQQKEMERKLVQLPCGCMSYTNCSSCGHAERDWDSGRTRYWCRKFGHYQEVGDGCCRGTDDED